MLKALWRSRAGKARPARSSQLISVCDFELQWRKSARRSRSMALKLDKAGQLIVMTPLNTPEQEVRRFVKARQAWINEQLAQHKSLKAQQERARGASLQWLGGHLNIEAGTGPRNLTERRGDVLCVISRRAVPDKDYLEQRAGKWLREQAQQILPERLQSLSLQTGFEDSGLHIKSYRARWGSCRHDGTIQLNWKLVMAPVEVIDYVIVHELSHLKHFNHSAAFWLLVEQHCPEYKSRRQWLKQHGRLLISQA